MIKYAKVINQETKQCEVGLGTNSAFYEKIGMTQQDVEQCEWNSQWYLAGSVPQEPAEQVKAKQIATLKEQLNDLDAKSTRSVRAILANTATEDDRTFLAGLETQAEAIRQQIRDLQGE